MALCNSNKITKNLVKFNNLTYEQIDIKLDSTINNSTNESTIQSHQLTSSEYGFVIAGYCPSYIENIADNSISQLSGLKKGDLIMKINNVNCCRATLKTILSLIKQSTQHNLTLTIYRRHAASKANKIELKSSVQAKKKLLIEGNLTVLSTKKRKLAANERRGKLLTKIFKPSLWLSCAQPIKVNSQNNTTFYSKESTNNKQQQKTMVTNLGDTEHIIVCQRECCKKEDNQQSSDSAKTTTNSNNNNSDTGYETISRYESLTRKTNSVESNDNDFTIETVVDTTNSYSQCDLTIERTLNNKKPCQDAAPVLSIKKKPSSTFKKQEKFNEVRTQLIGNLIEMEANFVSYLSIAVSTFTRPLRGFFIKQQDYFNLFQNIEKILIISENFLRSMDKWSAYDLYSRIGQFYTQKLNLFREAFTIYVKGYAKSKSLLNELKTHSKQFRLFLNEVQSDNLTLANLLDLPIVHMQQTLAIFKQIRRFTCESKRNPSEAPHIDSVIFELKKILINQEQVISCGNDQVDVTNCSNVDSTTFFMTESTIFSSCSIDSSCATITYIGGSSQNSDCTCTTDESSNDASDREDINSNSYLNVKY